jgi:hypothetical protein
VNSKQSLRIHLWHRTLQRKLKLDLNNTLIGATGKIHDSKSEAAASYIYAKYGCIPYSEFLPYDFYDKEGILMPSKPDFYHEGADLFIEHKAAPLNSITCKRVSQNRLTEKRDYRGGRLLTIDRLKFGWNHSKTSKQIIQAALTPQRYIVVFEKPPTDIEASAYLKAGLVFCPLSALPSYLGYVRLAKAGLDISFRLTYSDDEDNQTTLILH